MENMTQPLPPEWISVEVSELTRPFWEAARNYTLTALACSACGRFRMPPSPFCPHCCSKRFHWPTLSGQGRLYSFTVTHALPGAAVGESFLAAPALVELPDAENVRLFALVVGVEKLNLRIGMPLNVTWLESREGWRVPAFTTP